MNRTVVLTTLLVLQSITASAQELRNAEAELVEYYVAFHTAEQFVSSCVDIDSSQLACLPNRLYPSASDVPHSFIAERMGDYLCYEIYRVSDLSSHGTGWVLAVDDSARVAELFGFGQVGPMSVESCAVRRDITKIDAEIVVHRTLKFLYGGHPNDIEIKSVDYALDTAGIRGRASVSVMSSEGSKKMCLEYSIPRTGLVEVDVCE